MPTQTHRWKRLAVHALLCAAAIALARAGDQPQWGQRFSRNMASDEKNLPDNFDPKTGINIKWSVALGTSTHSTPVVVGGKVLIGTNNDDPRDPRNLGDRGVLMCFDEKDGKFCWQLAVPKITTSNFWDWPKAGICSTATVEGDRVYIVSNRGEVMCLDLRGMANGNDGPFRDEGRHMVPAGQPPLEPGAADADILWLFDMIKECGVRQHDSAHCSILLHGRFLYANTSNGVDDTHKVIASPDAPSLVVLDKTTGRLVARDDEHIGPNIFHCTWSSPALGEVNGRPLVFFAGGNGVVYAFEAVTDGVLESWSNGAMQVSSSQQPNNPTLHDSNSPSLQHFKTPSSHPPSLLRKVWWFDCDPAGPKENIHDYLRNREQSPVNIYGMPVFQNGRVYVAVGGDMWWGKRQAWLKCIDATKTGDITRSGALWSYPLRNHTSSTPAVHDGLVFIADCGKTIHCVDAATGAACWTHETKSDIWASPLVADGKLFIGTRRGEFVILAATREKKLLATIDMGAPISSSPVAANGVLYVATMNRLYAVQKASAVSSSQRLKIGDDEINQFRALLSDFAASKITQVEFLMKVEELCRTSEYGKQIQALGKVVDALENRALRGDSRAMKDLKALAANSKAPFEQRDMAFSGLAQIGTPDALATLALQLLSEDREIRCRAYYSLPKELQPKGFHYTKAPNNESAAIVNDLIKKIESGKLKPPHKQ